LTINKSTKIVSLDTVDKKKPQITPDKYAVLILNALNEGRPVKTKKGYTGKIKKLKSIARKLEVGETNGSLRNALDKCTSKQYVLEFKKKKDLAKIFFPNAEEYDLYRPPCYMLTQKGIALLNGIVLTHSNDMYEIIQNQSNYLPDISEDKINELLEIVKDIPNPFKILSELETLNVK